jgi:hypothetical protein
LRLSPGPPVAGLVCSSDTGAAIGTPLRRRTVLVSNVLPQTLAAASRASNSASVMRIIVCAIFPSIVGGSLMQSLVQRRACFKPDRGGRLITSVL